MCGIIGFYAINENTNVNKSLFENALEAIHHRGPDFLQTKYYNNDKVALGHARLSVIDLSESAHQPMQIDDYNIVFNGEIYNYIEIREELIVNGYQFTTNSDTEVLVKAFDFWGENCLNKLNGMWAFVIYNTKNNVLFCSRDRFGVKPFNYYINQDQFIFCSEIKGILAYDESLKIPNYNSISLFCREGICGEIEETWFQEIKRLMPGHNLIIKDGKLEIKKYYYYPSNKQEISFDQAKKQFKDLFIDAVNIRMRSDVPVGTTLSGGLDSTSIVSALRTFFIDKHDTFTAHFPEFKNDEYFKAQKTNSLFKLDGHPITVDFKDKYIEELEKIIYHLESGHLSPAIFPLWKVYEKSKENVTVLLEGQGADELLAGYINSFGGTFLIEKITNLDFGNFFRQLPLLKKNYGLKSMGTMTVRAFSPSFIKTFLRRYILKYEVLFEGKLKKFNYPKKHTQKVHSLLAKHLLESHQNTLVNLLHYGDALSMAFALESRLPFMDYRLVDFCFTLPSHFMINNGKGKFLLREALKEILPPHTYEDHVKLGFPSPIDEFFRTHPEKIKEIILSDQAKSRELFNSEKLEKFIDTQLYKSNNAERIIFRILCVELWFRKFID